MDNSESPRKKQKLEKCDPQDQALKAKLSVGLAMPQLDGSNDPDLGLEDRLAMVEPDGATSANASASIDSEPAMATGTDESNVEANRSLSTTNCNDRDVHQADAFKVTREKSVSIVAFVRPELPRIHAIAKKRFGRSWFDVTHAYFI